jgi:hypothetical protein
MSGAPDFASLLYLNPELSAYSNYTSISQLSNAWVLEGDGGSLSFLADSVDVPEGFEPRVYLGMLDSDVSTMNHTIREAMSNQGISTQQALDRRGQYLANLTLPAKIQSWNAATKEITVITTMSIESTNVQVGDQVILQRRDRGDSVQINVRQVSPFSLSGFAIYSSIRDAVINETDFTLSGIKVVDAQRQSLVMLSRHSNTSSIKIEHLYPDETFYTNVYSELYPGTKTLDRENGYVDYLRRFERNMEYRVTHGGDLFNVSAPYASNSSEMYPFPPPSGNTVDTYGYVNFLPTTMSVGCNLIMADGYSTVTVGENVEFYKGGPQLMNAADDAFVISANGDLHVGGANSNLVVIDNLSVIRIGHEMIDIDVKQSNVAFGMPPLLFVETLPERMVTVVDDVYIQGKLGVGMKCDGFEAFNVDDSGTVASNSTRVAVDGDVFTTGAVVTLSDRHTKDDLVIIDNPVERVKKLRGYTWLGAGNRRHTGLMAQDVAIAMPEAVVRNSSNMGVAYGNLVGLLTESINALVDRLEALEKRETLKPQATSHKPQSRDIESAPI